MLYYMNSDTGKVIAREIGDEPFGDLWFEISKEEYEETLQPLSPANTGVESDGRDVAPDIAAIEGGYDYVPDGYSICPVCKRMSLFNDECQNCGYGSGLWWD